MLSAEDQERFSRHLLLDQLGGQGQERICAGTVELDLPGPFAAVARSCARALAASGVQRLIFRGPWAQAASLECRRLAPALEIVSIEHEGKVSFRHEPIVSFGHEPKVSIEHEAPTVKVSIEHEASAASARAPAFDAVTIPSAPPLSLSDAHALGAFAALESLKRLANTGGRARLPLSTFPQAPHAPQALP